MGALLCCLRHNADYVPKERLFMKEDLTGKTFGRLTAIRPVRKEGNRKKFWLCSCSCGAEKIVEQSHLKSGHTQSWGCYRREAPREGHQALPGRRCRRRSRPWWRTPMEASTGTGTRRWWACSPAARRRRRLRAPSRTPGAPSRWRTRPFGRQ